MEVASGARYGRLVRTGAVGLTVARPKGLAAGATVGRIMAYEFGNHIRNKVTEGIKRESKIQLTTVDSIDHLTIENPKLFHKFFGSKQYKD